MDPSEPRLVPVIDILDGVVVRGVRGRRDLYRPLTSRWTSSTAPLKVANALRTHYGLRTLYVADLDAITAYHRGRPVRPPVELVRALTADGWNVWLDAAIGSPAEAERIITLGATPIVGLETLPSWEALDAICAAFGPRIIFSIDLQRGRPLHVPADTVPAASTTTRCRTPDGKTAGSGKVAEPPSRWQDMVRRAAAAGVRRMIVLDLDLVGSGAGAAAARYVGDPVFMQLPHRVRRITGGGVRSWDDCRNLWASGADTVLVASALHDGRMPPTDIDRLSAG